MTNTIDIDRVAEVAVRILDSKLVMTKKVFRGNKDQFEGNTNGYEKGSIIPIRHPICMDSKGVIEGEFDLKVYMQCEKSFTSKEFTQDIHRLPGIIMPAMVDFANSIDKNVPKDLTEKEFALVMVPMVSPPEGISVSHQSYEGTHIRVIKAAAHIPVIKDSDATEVVDIWRFDVLYGIYNLLEIGST